MAARKTITADWLARPGLQQLLQVLSGGDHEARIVGGAVRNALMGHAVKDIDIATTRTPGDVIKVAENAGFSAYATGIDHGTVTIVTPPPEQIAHEVTTLRRDVTTDGRRASVAYTYDWLEDAMRRDFTVNALYCDYLGTVFDPLNGIDDIVAGRVRFVGDADTRIREDYLRILRFFRFHAAYGKTAPDRAGLAACKRNKDGLKRLSGERIREELLRILVMPGAGPVIREMERGGFLGMLDIPEPRTELFNTMIELDQKTGLKPDSWLRLMALAGDHPGFYSSLRLSNVQALRIKRSLAAMGPTPALRETERKVILYQFGKTTFRDAARLAWARMPEQFPAADWDDLLRLPDLWQPPEFSVSGADLLSRGFQPGPDIGETLARLEDWWIAAGFPEDKTVVLAQLRKIRKPV